MKMGTLLTFMGVLIFVCSQAEAGTLTFPKTEQEVVDALSLKDGRTEYNGVTYLSERGKVYKLVHGKRFRLRGLDEIVDSELTPRAGAVIEFEYGKDVIQSKYFPLLEEFGKAFRGGLSNVTLIIAGHTCDLGSDEYNMRLSEKRARAVKEYLEQRDLIPADRLIIRAYGKTRPIAPNEDEIGRRLNRRVEFIRIDAP